MAAATFIKFVQFSKLEDSKEKDGMPTVWGVSTWEQPDSDQEICDYETAVPVYQAWSKKAFDRTSRAGQEPSLGNIRLQHGMEVGGKATKLEFDDKAKEIWLGSEPRNDEIRDELKKGFYTGYSQGGSYAWRACGNCEGQMPMKQGANWCETCGKDVTVRYGLKRLAEVSYVDSPATGEGFEHVKANGSVEILKFAKREHNVAKTKTVAGVALPAHCFAYVGDSEKTETWKLPIEFPGDDKKTKSHIRNALARFDQTQGIPDGERSKVKAKIEAAARAHGIEVDGEKSMRGMTALKASIDKAAEAKGMVKGLYDVSRFADVLNSMAYLYECAFFEAEMEGDESEVPGELKDLLDSMTETFIAMATEEARELSAKQKKGDTMKTAEELQKEAQELEKAAKKSLATHFAKAASHHEKLADVHEKMAAHHEKCMGSIKDCMGKAATAKSARVEALKAENATAKAAAEAKGEAFVAKEDVSSGAEHDPIHEVLPDLQHFHKSMHAEHMKKAKAHDKHAEHLQGMAEGYDEETGKAVKAELAKAYEAEVKLEKDATPTPKETPAAPTMDDDVKKAAQAARETPEYKDAVARIAKAQVDAEIAALSEKTLAPLGIKIDEATGQAIIKGGIKVVPRNEDASKAFDFAPMPSASNTAGL
jgi:hypothetical protein